jgi:RimJ/RimL family protein N-acetyltransferase
VSSRGGEPLYSTSWDNAASRALASRLEFTLLGEDRHWR